MNLPATPLACTGALACAVVATAFVLRGQSAEPPRFEPIAIESPEIRVDPAVAHEDGVPFAELFVAGASWTLPCFDERVDILSESPRVERATPTGDRRIDVLDVRHVAGIKLAHLADLGWYAMTDAGLYELGSANSSPYYAVERDPKADPNVPPHVTRYFFEQPRPGAFDAHDAALLRRRPPMIGMPPRETERFEPGRNDQLNMDENPAAEPHADGCGRTSRVFRYDRSWCLMTEISCGGGPHDTFLCVAQGRGLVGIGSGFSEMIYVGERCGDTPM